MQANKNFRKSAIALGVLIALSGGQAMAFDTSVGVIGKYTITGNNDGSNNLDEGVILFSNGPTGTLDTVRAAVSVLSNGVVTINGTSGVNINGGTTINNGATINHGTTLNNGATINGILNVANITNNSTIKIQGNNDSNSGGGIEGVILSSNSGTGEVGEDQATISVLTNGTVTVKGTTTIHGATTVGGTLGVTGATTLNGATAVNNTLAVTGETTINTTEFSATNIGNATGSTNINAGIAGTTNIGTGNAASFTNIGNSLATNTVSGASNTIIATGANTISGANNITTATIGANSITGRSGNTITATTGSNAIAATAGANNITAGTTNTLTGATGNTITATTGSNVMSANATDGTNNIEAKFNNIGVNTAASINAMGNTNAGTTVNAAGGNSALSVANGQASLRSGTSGFTATSALSTLSTNPVTLASQLNNVGDAASRQNIAGVSFVNRLEGNTLINGNTYINGTLFYTSNTAATTTVTSGASILGNPSQATTIQINSVNAGGMGSVVNANGKVTQGIVGQTTGSMTVTNGLGNTHGFVVTETQATMSGGVNSTSLTLDDNGATFSNAATGAPVQVHGVADGTSDFDAVNVRQFSSAIASVTAMANIPQVDPGKKVAYGVALGNFKGKTAFAGGITYRFTRNGVFKASIASAMNSTKSTAIGVGAAWSY